VPANFPIQLNTDSFKLLLPALYQKFPNTPMQLQIATTGAPLVPSIDPSGVNVSITFNITAAVVVGDGTNASQTITVFQLSNTAFAAGDFAVEARAGTQFLVANLTFIRAEFATAWVRSGGKLGPAPRPAPAHSLSLPLAS
jgi:hypothetical protein